MNFVACLIQAYIISNSFVYVAGGPEIKSIFNGVSHTCAVDNKGGVKCYGRNDYGQLGLETTEWMGDESNEMGVNLPFVNLGSNATAVAVFCGSYHTCAIMSDNNCKCWGRNQFGQLGVGFASTPLGDAPGEMGDNLFNVNFGAGGLIPVEIAVGHYHTCILFNNKRVKCFGQGGNGALGYQKPSDIGTSLNNMGDFLPFVDFGTNVEVSTIQSFGYSYYNCIIMSAPESMAGKMKCWGDNFFSQLGYGDTLRRGSAVKTMGNFLKAINLGTESRVKQISVGGGHTCGLRIDNELKCWGWNQYGQVGTGVTTSPIKKMGTYLISTPVNATSGNPIAMVSAGDNHTCMLMSDRVTLKCVGYNYFGQLGRGDQFNRGGSKFTTADTFGGIDLGTQKLAIRTIGTGSQYTCAIFVDSRIKCFGFAGNGNLGYGSTTSIGTSLLQMGTNLPFVEVFATKAPTRTPTFSPTNNPTVKCSYTTSETCLADTQCSWEKVNGIERCVFIECRGYNAKKCKKKKNVCKWDKATKTCDYITK